MLVTLDRKALESLLVDLAVSAHMIMRVISHCMRSAHPFHEATQLSVNKRPMYQVDVVGNYL